MDTHEPVSDPLEQTSRQMKGSLGSERLNNMTNDQGGERSPEEMHNQIAQRRELISQQLGQLETRIEDRVYSAVDRVSGNFEQMFSKVTGTVERGVEEANHLINEGVSSVKDRLEHFTKDTLQEVDVKTAFERFPLAMFGASVLAGAFIGRNLVKTERLMTTESETTYQEGDKFRQTYQREYELNESLDDSFPASDPPSQTQASMLGRPDDNSRGAFTYQ